METASSKGWDRASRDLFIHNSGARVSKTEYRGKLAWWFFPADLDAPAVEHAPTDAGREDAFATSVNKPSKPKTKAKENPGKKKIADPRNEDTEPKDRPQHADSDPNKEEDIDEEEEDED